MQAVFPLLLFSVLFANIATASVMSFFGLAVARMAVVYVLALTMGGVLFRRANIPLPVLSRRELLLVVGVGLALALPRITYLVEPALGHVVPAANFDDYWHIQELSSLAYSERFPPRSSFDHDFFLGFYYAPWMLMAAIFKAGGAQTLRQAFFLGTTFYQLSFVYVVLCAGRVLFTERRQRLAFVATVLAYGGFDFIYAFATMLRGLLASGQIYMGHAEWWAVGFGYHLQYSNFATLSLWVPHHLVAAVAIVIGLYCVHQRRTLAGAAIFGAALASAVFSSVFVILGALPVLAVLSVRLRLALKLLAQAAIVATLLSLPLVWMYLAHDREGFRFLAADNEFLRNNLAIGFLVFLLVVCLEFLPIICASWLAWRKGRFDLVLAMPAAGFILSTFAVDSWGLNNYAMRGSIVPIFVMLYLAAPGFGPLFERGRVPLKLLVLPFFLGAVWEYGRFTASAMRATSHDVRFGSELLAANLRHGEAVGAQLVQMAESNENGWYLIENFKSTPKLPLLREDRELMLANDEMRIRFGR
jgi:hypothetical protein